jgi:putative ATPase
MDLFAEAADVRRDIMHPLADRMRPRRIDEVVGQEHVIGPGRPLRVAIESGRPPSMVLWGPPGSGKTSLAAVIAAHTDARMVAFSAVTGGIPEVRRIIETAAQARAQGKRTILFVDEIHRFNSAQQDAFLPHVERGTITLIGATTENPSFEVNAALNSRLRTFILNPLGPDELRQLVGRALSDRERGLGDPGWQVATDAETLLVQGADGDARRLLATLELAAEYVRAKQGASGGSATIDAESVAAVQGGRTHHYDKIGEEHYNLISALHKSLRGSDADAALYWLYRMLESGEDPMFIARRLIRFASEDVGLADSHALVVAVAAREAYHMLGSPEGELALAHATAYLARAPKDVSVYKASGAIKEQIARDPDWPVPLHLRNAPTALMKAAGYGRDYRYPPDDPAGAVRQTYLPPELEGTRWLDPEPPGESAV